MDGFTDIRNPFSVANVSVGSLLILGGLIEVFSFQLFTVLLGLFLALFGFLSIYMERTVPNEVSQSAPFLLSLLGRGGFYVFLGVLMSTMGGFRKFLGIIILAVGGFFSVCHFSPNMREKAPRSLRDNEWDDTVVDV
ncbi:COPI-coated vesicle associated protein [Schizosaccharomyces japonicus yFS275]|uniref:COPI-coated vesicle associated protein n=1 Tax=Schizosaccharomyces japonicus (strain yFS275 / FY16936) TaxID=402676 RepID=B6K420_SCHJY|nr:COPI-coated vesicle associated protein [Schizosaccharomyces japonicus yFS275]EEB08227.1 COPI-coated vesicle associated protein [Schizosaccharomyces japonicus yFS275]